MNRLYSEIFSSEAFVLKLPPLMFLRLKTIDTIFSPTIEKYRYPWSLAKYDPYVYHLFICHFRMLIDYLRTGKGVGIVSTFQVFFLNYTDDKIRSQGKNSKGLFFFFSNILRWNTYRPNFWTFSYVSFWITAVIFTSFIGI